MTSRHWKDLREKESFAQQLRELWDIVAQSPERDTLAEAIERQYLEDCRNGLFDDDYGDIDDWFDDECDWRDNDEPQDDYRYLDWRDEFDEQAADDVKPLPGWHVRLNGTPYLVLRSGKWANMLTGSVIYGSSWVRRENVIFGL